MKRAAQVHVEAGEDLAAAIDQRGLDTQAVEDVGELDGDIAAAGDGDRLRQFGKVESLVGGDRVLVAGQGGMRRWAAAGGDEDRGGADLLAGRFDPHRVLSGQRGAALDDLGPGIVEALAVETLEARDLAILVGDELRPVERGIVHSPAISGRILKMLGKLRGVDVELLRHAAADDAGAAEPEFLGDRHALAEAGGKPPRPHAAGTAADDKQVVIEFAHVAPCPFHRLRARVMRSRRKRKARREAGLVR